MKNPDGGVLAFSIYVVCTAISLVLYWPLKLANRYLWK